MNSYIITVLMSILINLISCDNSNTLLNNIDAKRTRIWGPGLKPDIIISSARYFFIHAVDANGKDLNVSLPERYDIKIHGNADYGACRASINQIDRKDGSVIVRYKIFGVCRDVSIHIKYNNQYLGASPYVAQGDVYAGTCICPQPINTWMKNVQCPDHELQIEKDLKPFQKVNFTSIRQKMIQKYNSPGSISICNYVVKNNEIYRKCYGQYTGFKMFVDSILLALTRKINLPDIEFFANLGDWPLVKKGGHTRTTGPYPVFSWCGNDETFDIVMPTYDITESTIENMGRVTLDMLSVQKVNKMWHQKTERAFWRGRDSRRERLDLIDISRENPELINASLTNFFFFRDEEQKYGPKEPHVSFLEFFEYKYQISIDGTVAAYRFPYLLAGNSVVFKQDSPYYEHFYSKLTPNEHYIPVKRDLSDLVAKIKWAQANDDKAQEIMQNARHFAQQNLMPMDIFCYHTLLFREFSSRIISNIQVLHDMEPLIPPPTDCVCPPTSPAADVHQANLKDEL